MTGEHLYFKAGLDGLRFAIAASQLDKVETRPVCETLPDAPDGICGLVYDAGEILPIFTLSALCAAPTGIILLCRRGGTRIAFAADRVDGFVMLPDDALQGQRYSDKDGELLLP
ncbi:MAG: chemotaxis protein CheW [Oscillospiraceae bacterium]|nr:chemotaxis protein CheW [Oscillospiraceae bacterium]